MITIPISDRLICALCDTLIHSLWQGVLLAAIGGLIVICTRKASSVLRYNLLVSAAGIIRRKGIYPERGETKP
jgi:bla regulator protein BlaR1